MLRRPTRLTRTETHCPYTTLFLSKTVSGLALVEGLAMGHAVYHQPRVTIDQVMAEDLEAERQRVYQAFDRMRGQIEQMASQAEFGVGGEHEEVLETYKMFAYDEGWSRRINEANDSGLTAEPATQRYTRRASSRQLCCLSVENAGGAV